MTDMSVPPMNSPIGQPLRRREDQRFLTGAGQYTDDVLMPGQTYGVFVRSPHAHARISAIRTDAAKRHLASSTSCSAPSWSMRRSAGCRAAG